MQKNIEILSEEFERLFLSSDSLRFLNFDYNAQLLTLPSEKCVN